MRGYGEVSIRTLVVIAIVSLLLLVEIVVATQAYFYNLERREINRKQITQPNWELQDLLLAQQAELNSYRWVDLEEQRVAIPIDRAIELYVSSHEQRQATRPE